MNILYINQYAGSLAHGMEYRPYYLAREWVKLGHTVTIVAGNYSHLRQNNIKVDPQDKFYTEYIDGIEYIWCKTNPYKKNGLKRVINIWQFIRQVNKLKKFLVDKKPNLVIASSTHPFDTKIANKIARSAKAKFIYEVHDLWPLTPIEVGGMSKYHPFIWLMQKFEDFAYKNADKVISLLPKASSYMQMHGMSADKFIYIPNGVDVNSILKHNCNLPYMHQNEISKMKLRYRFVVGYAGGMGDANALEYLVEVAKLLPDVAFILVGNGVNKNNLIKQSDVCNNVLFLDSITKSQVPAFLAECDVLYIGWHDLSIYRFGICPNKLFDYMLSKKPIIHSTNAGNDLVEDANCGISVPATDINEIVLAIKNMINIKILDRNNLGENGYDYVLKNHDYKILATKFLTAI